MIDHNEIFMRMLLNKRVMGSLLRAFGPLADISPSWIQAMDLRTLSRLSSKHVSQDFMQRYGKLAWRVRLRDRPGQRLGRSAIILPRVCSAIDRMMPLHTVECCQLLQQALDPDLYATGGKLTPGIPLVIYHGEPPWDAPTDTAGLYHRVGKEPVGRVLGSLKYFLLDIGAMATRDLPKNELMSCLIRQQNAKSADEVWSALREVYDLLNRSNPWQRRTRLEFYQHARHHPLMKHDGAFPTYESLEHDLQREDIDMTTVTQANAKRWFEEVRAQGQQELLHLLTDGRFGARTTTTLIEQFQVTEYPERLAKVGEWIYECETGGELLARAEDEWD